jgi:hypothetical protein
MSENQVEIHVSDELNANQRSWLVTKLGKEAGIIGAWFPGGNPHRLRVRYEHAHFSHATLLDTIAEHGFHGRLAGDDDPDV